RRPGSSTALSTVLLVACIAVAVVAIALLVVVVEANAARGTVAATLVATAGALVVATASTTWWADLDPNRAVELPGVAAAVSALFAAQLAMLLVLFALGRWRRSQCPETPIALWGCATAC